MGYTLAERLKLICVRKFTAIILFGTEGEYAERVVANYAGGATLAVMMFLRDLGIEEDYKYYFRLLDVDGVVTYWLVETAPETAHLIIKPCPREVWFEISAGASNTRTSPTYVESLGSGDEWQAFRESMASGECD